MLEPAGEGSARRADADSARLDRHFVSFTVDEANVVTSKMIESERTLYEPAPNGQDKLATYRADSAGAVDLDWWDPSAGEIDWSIRRDGVPVANVNGSSFTDRRTQVSAKATYVIEGEWSTTGESYLTQIDVPAIDTSAVGLPSTDRSLSAASNTDVLSQVASALRAVQLDVVPRHVVIV